MAKSQARVSGKGLKPPSKVRAKAGRSVWREYTEAILIAAIILRFTNAFVLQTFYIPSQSMEDTLLVGDHLFVNRFIYGTNVGGPLESLLPTREVRRGDIVVFRSKLEPIDVVKRCVGLPGDEIRVLDKELYVNGEKVRDDGYTKTTDPIVYRDLPAYTPNQRRRDNFGPLVVPEGHYFFMGDNRDNSLDSRFWGTLPAHLVKGRASFIYWSYAGPMASEDADGVTRLKQIGRTAVGFFRQTRWHRTFRVVR